MPDRTRAVSDDPLYLAAANVGVDGLGVDAHRPLADDNLGNGAGPAQPVERGFGYMQPLGGLRARQQGTLLAHTLPTVLVRVPAIMLLTLASEGC